MDKKPYAHVRIEIEDTTRGGSIVIDSHRSRASDALIEVLGIVAATYGPAIKHSITEAKGVLDLFAGIVRAAETRATAPEPTTAPAPEKSKPLIPPVGGF